MWTAVALVAVIFMLVGCLGYISGRSYKREDQDAQFKRAQETLEKDRREKE